MDFEESVKTIFNQLSRGSIKVNKMQPSNKQHIRIENFLRKMQEQKELSVFELVDSAVGNALASCGAILKGKF